MDTAAEVIYDLFGIRKWESAVVDTNDVWYTMKEEVDTFYNGLEQALISTPHLRAFRSISVPRILDLITLLNRYCSSIQSIDISACRKWKAGPGGTWICDTIELRPFPAIDLLHW